MSKIEPDFDTAFERLRLSYAAEKELEAKHKKQIVDAPLHGITDTDLIRLLKRTYSALKITPAKLKSLRAKWELEPNATPADLASNPHAGNHGETAGGGK